MRAARLSLASTIRVSHLPLRPPPLIDTVAEKGKRLAGHHGDLVPLLDGRIGVKLTSFPVDTPAQQADCIFHVDHRAGTGLWRTPSG